MLAVSSYKECLKPITNDCPFLSQNEANIRLFNNIANAKYFRGMCQPFHEVTKRLRNM